MDKNVSIKYDPEDQVMSAKNVSNAKRRKGLTDITNDKNKENDG